MKSKILEWFRKQHWLIEREFPMINVWLKEPSGDLEKYWYNKGEWKFGKKVFIKTDKDFIKSGNCNKEDE